jgi:hypothetical protein
MKFNTSKGRLSRVLYELYRNGTEGKKCHVNVIDDYQM